MKNLVMKNLIDKLIEKHMDPNIEFTALSNRKTAFNEYAIRLNKRKRRQKLTIEPAE